MWWMSIIFMALGFYLGVLAMCIFSLSTKADIKLEKMLV